MYFDQPCIILQQLCRSSRIRNMSLLVFLGAYVSFYNLWTIIYQGETHEEPPWHGAARGHFEENRKRVRIKAGGKRGGETCLDPTLATWGSFLLAGMVFREHAQNKCPTAHFWCQAWYFGNTVLIFDDRRDILWTCEKQGHKMLSRHNTTRGLKLMGQNPRRLTPG